MTQVHNPQWNHDMHVDTALMRRMQMDNFQTSHTGGGCFAWERPTDDGGWVWITEESGSALGAWKERNKRVWLIGRYSSDMDDWITVDSITLPEALRLADTLRAPKPEENIMLAGIPAALAANVVEG